MSGHPTRPVAVARRSKGVAVIRPAAFTQLTRALDAAVALDATLAHARAALLSPVRLLEAIAEEAPGGLGDDVIAAERLRLLISLAEPQAPSASMVSSMLSGSSTLSSTAGVAAAVATPGRDPAMGAPCAPALLHMGALVIVGLAAGRAGSALGLSGPMINNVLGLALAAGPAEALTRAIAAGMTPAQLAAALASLAGRDTSRTVSATVASFLADSCERTRWACLNAIFTQVLDDVNQTHWDAAGNGSIIGITPPNACAGEVIRIELDNVSLPVRPTLDAAHFLPLLAERPAQARVVFAALGKRTIARRPLLVDPANGIVQVRVPSRAHSGWIGFTDAESLRLSNADRTALRAAWDQLSKVASCFRDAPVPTDAIPLLPDPPTPPRAPTSRFDGGLPLITEASLTPEVVDIGGTLEIRWQVEGASTVVIAPFKDSVEPSGTQTFTAPPDHARIERTVLATNRCGQRSHERLRARVRGRITNLVLEQEGRQTPLVAAQPLDLRATVQPPDVRGPALIAAGRWVRWVKPNNGLVEVTIPESVVTDGLVGTVRILAPDDRIDDERTFGPLTFAKLERRTIVLVRPAAIGRSFRRVPATTAAAAMNELRRKHALELNVVEPAWIDDHDLVWPGPIDGRDVPATDFFLDRLNLLAARTPGLEDALWLALVPGPQRADGFHRLEPAEGARAVAVCTADRLEAVLTAELPPVQAATDRLRVIGVFNPDGSVKLEGMRVEERMAGSGAPCPTDLVACAIANQSLRAAHPLSTMTRNRPTALVALLPITDDVDALELRSPRSEMAAFVRDAFDFDGPRSHPRRVVRSRGEPELNDVELRIDTLSWNYHHTRSARSSFTIELGRDDIWSPVLVLGGCDEAAEVPLERIAAAARVDRIRVVASDGWNAAFGPVAGLELPTLPEHRVIARYDGRGSFWADLDFDTDDSDDARITWTFGGEQRTGPHLVLPRGFTGEVTVTVDAPEDTLFDYRTIGPDGKVDDRGLRWPQEGRRA